MKPLLKYIGASAVALILIGSLTGNVLLYKQVRTLKSDPAYAATKENDTVVADVRGLMILPDETPTVATVTDPEKLKNQPFFEKAKKGDKVLIFTAAKKAVLYDPVARKIVETAPLSATDTTAAASGVENTSGTSGAEESSVHGTNAPKKPVTKSKTGTTNVNAAAETDASQ